MVSACGMYRTEHILKPAQHSQVGLILACSQYQYGAVKMDSKFTLENVTKEWDSITAAIEKRNDLFKVRPTYTQPLNILNY